MHVSDSRIHPCLELTPFLTVFIELMAFVHSNLNRKTEKSNETGLEFSSESSSLLYHWHPQLLFLLYIAFPPLPSKSRKILFRTVRCWQLLLVNDSWKVKQKWGFLFPYLCFHLLSVRVIRVRIWPADMRRSQTATFLTGLDSRIQTDQGLFVKVLDSLFKNRLDSMIEKHQWLHSQYSFWY